VPKWYTNLSEVGVRQFEQNFSVDFVFTDVAPY
jgi:hypothetical protein